MKWHWDLHEIIFKYNRYIFRRIHHCLWKMLTRENNRFMVLNTLHETSLLNIAHKSSNVRVYPKSSILISQNNTSIRSRLWKRTSIPCVRVSNTYLEELSVVLLWMPKRLIIKNSLFKVLTFASLRWGRHADSVCSMTNLGKLTGETSNLDQIKHSRLVIVFASSTLKTWKIICALTE